MLLVLLDDMGVGASSAFGGPCSMPTAEALADGGLRYTRFHTTAMCSPTRAALMTGRNHHAVGMGNVAELSTDAPGYAASAFRGHRRGHLCKADAFDGRTQHRHEVVGDQRPRDGGLDLLVGVDERPHGEGAGSAPGGAGRRGAAGLPDVEAGRGARSNRGCRRR